MPELKILEVCPSEEKLRRLVLAGKNPDGSDTPMLDIAQQLIDKWKLPFIIVDGELRSSYTQGELYLQQFITVDPETLQMKEDAVKMAKTDHEVLVMGETGTGKELIAKSMINDRKGALKAVNCAGLPRELIESELFGHVQGGFTGATRTKEGLITAAENGVMFLDEIGELPMDVQSKLLRALQDRTLRKVGGNQEEKINCKFVCATNRDLKAMVKEGTFKLDLYARISTLELHIKPLSKRKCDIIPITSSLPGGKLFLEKYKDELAEGLLDLSLNVRSIQQHVIRYNVLGRVTLER